MVEFECGADFVGWNRHLFGDREGERARRRCFKGHIEVCRAGDIGGDGVKSRAPHHPALGLTRQIDALENTPIHQRWDAQASGADPVRPVLIQADGDGRGLDALRETNLIDAEDGLV